MIASSTVDEGTLLLGRVRAASARSRELATRSAQLAEESRHVCAAAEQLRDRIQIGLAALRDRRGADAPSLGSWYVSGIIDGQLVSVRWDPVHQRLKDCHPEIARRADLVVAMGEEFVVPDSGASIAASLADGAGPALLTVLRAVGTVLTVELDVAEGVRPDTADGG